MDSKSKYVMTLKEWQILPKNPNDIIVQNSTINGADGLTPSSIGMCYGFLNVLDKLSLEELQYGNHSELVCCNINEETESRRRSEYSVNRSNILKNLKHNGINNIKLPVINYYKNLPNYKFVISPEGNGVDCHRHYEALMAGCIPIVEYSSVMPHKYGTNIPILYTYNYEEINENYLNEIYTSYCERTFDFSKLFLESWPKEEIINIKNRGNIWCSRLCGKLYYY